MSDKPKMPAWFLGFLLTLGFMLILFALSFEQTAKIKNLQERVGQLEVEIQMLKQK